MTLEDLQKKREKQRCFYTKQEIQKILTEISQKIEVNELPNTGVENYLYLVPSQVQEGYYLQYIWKDGQWQYLGESEVDLTDYVTDLELEMGLNTKQDTLVSGTNIKTINQQTLLDSGNLQLQPKTVTASTIPDTGALPNVCYNLGTTDTVSITLAAGESGVVNVWMFTFTAQSASCSVTLPSGVTLANEYAWDMAAGRRFEVTIMDGVATVIYSN